MTVSERVSVDLAGTGLRWKLVVIWHPESAEWLLQLSVRLVSCCFLLLFVGCRLLHGTQNCLHHTPRGKHALRNTVRLTLTQRVSAHRHDLM